MTAQEESRAQHGPSRVRGRLGGAATLVVLARADPRRGAGRRGVSGDDRQGRRKVTATVFKRAPVGIPPGRISFTSAWLMAAVDMEKVSAYASSKRSRFITLVHAAMKSFTNFFSASVLP